MQITMNGEYNGKRRYDVVLSGEDFAHMSAGFPEVDSLRGVIGRMEFLLYQGTRMPERFLPMPDGGAYQAHIGLEDVPSLPPDPSSEDFDRMSDEYDRRFRNAINASAPIPIVSQGGPRLGEITLGYVKLSVEPQPSPQMRLFN